MIRSNKELEILEEITSKSKLTEKDAIELGKKKYVSS
jgi:hypothetical protein